MVFFLTGNDRLAESLRSKGHIALLHSQPTRPLEVYTRIQLADVFVITRSTTEAFHQLGYALGKDKPCVAYGGAHRTIGIKVTKSPAELISWVGEQKCQ